MRISGLPGKLLSSVLSASMVIAFAPAVASATVTSNEKPEGSEANWTDESAARAGYCFKKTVDGVSTYYTPGEVSSAGENSTLELMQNYKVESGYAAASLPAGTTLKLNGHHISGEGDVLTSLGDVTIDGTSSTYSSISSLKAAENSTVTIAGTVEVNSVVMASETKLSENAKLTAQSIDGDVEMGANSTLHVYNHTDEDKATGINGNLAMNADAAGAAVDINIVSSDEAVGINNIDDITVGSGQALEVNTYSPNSKDVAISGNLNVENGADVDISTGSGYMYGGASSTAVGGNLKAATGLYKGLIKGPQSSVTGGTYSLNPISFVADKYNVKLDDGDGPGYVVVPASESGTLPANLHWGSDEASGSSAPYAINFTSTSSFIGSHRVEILKEEDGVFRAVYEVQHSSDEGGIRSVSDNAYNFHWLLEQLKKQGSESLNGNYKFAIAEVDGDKTGSFAVSDAYRFSAPNESLGAVTDLHWNAAKPGTVCFTLPEGATGYKVTIYKRHTDGKTFNMIGDSSSVYSPDGRHVEESLNSNTHQMLKENGIYKFSVHAYSPNLEECLDGPESALSDAYNFGEANSNVASSVNSSSDNGESYLTGEDSTVVGAAMVADDAARNAIAEAESKYKEAKKVQTDVVSSNDAIDGSKISAVGAAYNAAEGTKVELQVSTIENKKDVSEDPSLKSVIQFSMDLVQTSNGNEVKLGKDEPLKVPVCVTIPVPSGMNNLRIWHYHNNGTHETIWPVVFTEGGQAYARFYVTSFSDFVLLAGPESSDAPSGPSGGSTGGSTGGSGSGGGSTIVTPPSTDPSTPGTDEPSKPNEPTTPDTPAADGPEVGTVATVSGITYKVTAAGEVEVSKLPAGKKTVTVPAKVKVGGKSCAVAGIASGLLKGSKATTLVIKSKDLTKKSVKNALKGSKVKVVKIKVSGKKSVNKKYVKQYKKIFTKKICGKKVTVK